ncbi:GDSL-type esterase/lipase family protein [Enterobacter sp. ECC-175]|uniref:cytidylyltransferase domain-containing protein n=1 Tax=unclassified Enterobacter TaxID=2608935 RepID=UPI000D447B59|nr:GDSL-type esterase/lipase family protein [Enterobacter sp. RIT 418]RAU36889.1 acylneuraminate cytidylyltransferase [Enterobacter sp. RIT 418]
MVNRIAIIPARSGSKGLKNKNILMLGNKPLIAYTIEAALVSQCFSKVIVSTDSLEYKNIAEQYGAQVVMRSKELASDTASSFMVVEDVLKQFKRCDYFVLLQPTSPFRDARHIQESIDLFEASDNTNFLVSVTESSKSSELVKPLDASLKLTNFSFDFSNYRRQDAKEYSPNGAIFIGKKDEYLHKKHFFGADSVAYIMSKADSIDIDDRLDFEFAISQLLKRKRKETMRFSIKKRIKEKFANEIDKKPITLIGHSIFDDWDLERLNDKDVNNFGISGITSEEYYELILSKNLIDKIGDAVLLISGTNDIVLENWTAEYTVFWSKKIIEKIKSINSNVVIYFLSVPPVLGRLERDNSVIEYLNKVLEKEIKKIHNVNWVPINESFYDQFGNLKAAYTYDGLHFTQEAYEQLECDLRELIL